MKDLRKRALALLCLTALAALTGCGLQITIDVAPTATPLALPTSTPAAAEETPTAPATALAPPTGTAAADPIPATPAPTAPTAPTAAATTTPTATPAPTTTPAPSAPSQRSSREEALEIFGGPYLNEDEEIASLCAEWGIQDERQSPGVAFRMKADGKGRWSAMVLLKYGSFYARYDEDLNRTSSFYIHDEKFMGYKIGNTSPLDGKNWGVVLRDVPREEVPEDFPLIAGFKESDFGDTVDLLCLLSDRGEVLGGYVSPAERVPMFSGTHVSLIDPGKGSVSVDLETNTVDRSPQDSKRRFADGSYVESAESVDEKEKPKEIHFCHADGTVYRTIQPEEFYDRIDEELAARSRDGYTFSLTGLHYIQFVSHTECHILFYPYIEYNGEYISTSYELCLLEFEV